MTVDSSNFIALDSLDAQAVSQPEVLSALHALADANRLRIFELLRHGERCVCDIETGVHLPQNLVSHHLRVLREAGLIRARRDGRWAYYSVNIGHLTRIHSLVTMLLDPSTINDELTQC
jgi:ArsR family transcriptional regulator